jgi:hypothetical protein
MLVKEAKASHAGRAADDRGPETIEPGRRGQMRPAPTSRRMHTRSPLDDFIFRSDSRRWIAATSSRWTSSRPSPRRPVFAERFGSPRACSPRRSRRAPDFDEAVHLGEPFFFRVFSCLGWRSSPARDIPYQDQLPPSAHCRQRAGVDLQGGEAKCSLWEILHRVAPAEAPNSAALGGHH